MNDNRPIFYSSSQRRWKYVKNFLRGLLVIALILGTIVSFAIYLDSGTPLPHFHNTDIENTAKVHPTALAQKQANQEYQQLRKQLETRINRRKLQVSQRPTDAKEIRGGFFVNWDAQSYYTLRDHIDELNTIYPEWSFVPDQGDTVATDVDGRAYQLMKSHRAAIVPMVSNYYNEKWNGTNVERILATPQSRQGFIQSLLAWVTKEQFQGVNIDFENLDKMSDDQKFVDFMRELYQAFHPHGLIVCQDIAPFNEDYNLSELSKYNDYLILMAYDQHASESAPGPIGEKSWVESAIAQALEKIPPQKLVVGLATYGYDWGQNGTGKDVTFQEAVVTAKENEVDIDFDTSANELRYEYTDDNDSVKHEVHFNDALNNFNIMRSAEDMGTHGFAVWRLGSEDSRLWKFFGRDLTLDGLKKTPFDFSSLVNIHPIGADVDFEGEGEVLDVVATPSEGVASFDVDSNHQIFKDENFDTLPSSYLIRKYGGKPSKRIILTFDDGPSSEWTPQILDILEKEHVPATFFVIGINAENQLPLLRRMYKAGFEIGDHSFSHPNLAMVSRERAELEINATRRLIESATGHSTILFRPPYNADAEPENAQELIPVEIGKSLNMLTIGESIDPLDWEVGVSVDSIMARIKDQDGYGNMILLHDAGGDRSATVKALPLIIEYYRSRGFEFTTVAGLLGKKRDDLMPALSNPKDIWLAHANSLVSQIVYWFQLALFGLFYISIIISVLRILTIGIMAYIQKARLDRHPYPTLQNFPAVSIIVPAYNEEINACKTVERLLESDYPNLEILFVDDGSKDNTFAVVSARFGNDPQVTVMTKENGGKASALNYGIEHARGEILVCIDADTVLEKDAIRRLIEAFVDEKTGAVAGNVKVGNEKGILTLWQSVEYISSQNFDRRAFDLINGISVIPGAIGAFRRDAIQGVGGFQTDTLAEDCDLTIRLLRQGWRVRYNSLALAWTEVPETLNMFLRQRFRWSFGILQAFWKHKECLLNKEFGALAFVALPNMLIFQLLLPLLAPAADVVMILALFNGQALTILVYFLIYLALETVAAAVAFRFEKEPLGRLWVIGLQRFIYRYLMYWALLQSMISALRGEQRAWGVLKRTGNVDSNKRK